MCRSAVSKYQRPRRKWAAEKLWWSKSLLRSGVDFCRRKDDRCPQWYWLFSSSRSMAALQHPVVPVEVVVESVEMEEKSRVSPMLPVDHLVRA
jgi:hypothetical protein